MALSLRSVLSKGLILAPDTWDGISTRAAEKMGARAGLFSATALSHCFRGIPDEGVLGVMEMVWTVSRVVEDNCSIPLIIDVRSGFSDNLRVMPYDLERIVKAGAAAMMLDDRAYGCGADSPELTLVPEEVFAGKIAIAKKAAENTDCMILARSFAEDPDEAVSRLRAAQKAGAEMVGAAYAHTKEQAEELSRTLPGKKFWNDLTVSGGTPEVTCEELEKLGYGLVLITFLERASWFGNLEFGIRNYQNGNTVYADLNDLDGLLRDQNGNLEDYHVIFSYWKKWMPLEKRFMDLSELGDEAYQFGRNQE